MAATGRIRGVAGLALAGVLVGALAALLNNAGVVLIAGVLGLWLAGALINFRVNSGEERAWHPVLMVVTCLAVLSVAWSGFPPKDAALPDLLLVVALVIVLYCWAQETIQLPLPGWLLGAGALLIASQLL